MVAGKRIPANSDIEDENISLSHVTGRPDGSVLGSVDDVRRALSLPPAPLSVLLARITGCGLKATAMLLTEPRERGKERDNVRVFLPI